MKPLLLLLALSALPGSAAAQTIDLRLTGTVLANGISSGPYGGVPPGAPVDMRLAALLPGAVAAPGQAMSYPIAPGTFVLDVGSGSAGMTAGAITVTNDFPVSDGVLMTMQVLDVPGHVFELNFADSTGDTFDSPELDEIGGLVLASAFDAVQSWLVFGPGGLLEIQLSALHISGGLSPNFCTSVPNSSGQAATIHASGSADVTANDFTLIATDVPSGVSALFFFGTTPVSQPFGDGIRCVAGAVQRIPPGQADGAGTFAQMIDLTQYPQIQPNTTFYFQCWFRDPPAMLSGFNLSDGFQVDFQ